MRAAAEPAAGQERPTIVDWTAGQWERLRGRLRRVDVRVGPLIGYERLSELPIWPRRAVFAGSALLVLVGAVGFLNLDGRVRDGGYLGPVATQVSQGVAALPVHRSITVAGGRVITG